MPIIHAPNPGLAGDGDVNSGIERARVAAAKLRAAQQKLHGLPDAETAAADLETAEQALSGAERDMESIDDNLIAAQQEIAAVEADLHMAKRALSDAVAAHAAATEQEARDYANGSTVTDADIASTEAAAAAARRRVSALEAKLVEVTPPRNAAQVAKTTAVDELRAAQFAVARARAVLEAVERIPAVAPLQQFLVEAEARAKGFTGAASAVRSMRALREGIAAALGCVGFPTSGGAGATFAPKASALAPTASEEGNLVEMVVRPGNRYDGHRAGERVFVSAAEAALQSRRSGVLSPEDGPLGAPMGALMTVDEHDEMLAGAATAEERARPKHSKNPIVAAVERGMETAAEIAQGKRAAREAREDLERRAQEGLARIAAHNAAAAASTPVEREKRLARHIATQPEE